MIYCSNPNSVGMRYVGVKSTLTIKDRFYFLDMYSNTIQDVSTDDSITTIKTRNTEYQFEEITDEDDKTE